MAEISNLNKLTEKIYREGIEKAESDSKEILSKAETVGQSILQTAKEEAKKIVTDAQNEANRLSRSTEKELQLKGLQLVSDLQIEIQNMLSHNILEKSTKGAFADMDFLKSCILEAISSWNPNDDLELILPKGLEDKLETAFRQSVHDQAKNLTLTFNNKLEGGFRIIEKKEGYQISFSEEDFIALFTPYLYKQTENLLFNR